MDESAGYYQPQPQPPMAVQPPEGQQQQTTVIIQQPAAISIAQNTREWSHGLCACCEDLGECTLPRLLLVNPKIPIK